MSLPYKYRLLALIVIIQSFCRLIEADCNHEDGLGSVCEDATLQTIPAPSLALTRQLQQQQQPPYFSANNSTLGFRNYDVTLGNPFRGFSSDPNIENSRDASKTSPLSFSLESYYVRFDSVLRGPDTYDWSSFETSLNKCSSRKSHSIPRFFLHYPGDPIAVPGFLGAPTVQYSQLGGGYSPDYRSPILQDAIKKFIYAFGKKYDGDKRIAFIQAGLLGFWGEWHVLDNDFLPNDLQENVYIWYDEAFSKTPIQVRYPRVSAYQRKFGYYDDSFTFSTLDGPLNGGKSEWWFFWREVQALKQEDSWKYAPTGGEVRPENVGIVFQEDYATGTEYKQDFFLCTLVTHATYMKVGDLFKDSGMGQFEINRAQWNNARMGYSFQMNLVNAYQSTTQGMVDLDVILEQIGVAPFYYPLSLVLTCPGLATPMRVDGIEKFLIEQSQTKSFQFKNIPANSACLDAISISLDSPMQLPGRPIKFAQGSTGLVSLKVPLPLSSGQVPLRLPSGQVPLPPTAGQVPLPPTSGQVLLPPPSGTSSVSRAYFITSGDSLGARNYDVTVGNPLRGLTSDPIVQNGGIASGVSFSLESFYIRLDSVLKGLDQYDWTAFEQLLNVCSARKSHSIPRFFLHYPGNAIALPNSMINQVPMVYYKELGGGMSPDYRSPFVQDIIRKFIYAFGKKYDGDKRIAFIQAGLIGFWGDGHVLANDFLPKTMHDNLHVWYDEAFSKTPIQVRFPAVSAYERKFGYYDSSFTFATLDGQLNGNKPGPWFFWPSVQGLLQQDFWKSSVMGGDIRSENVDTIFQEDYATGTENKQDFFLSNIVTHATYAKAGNLFRDNNIGQFEKNRAQWNNARMGYSFQIQQVSASRSSISALIDINVVVEQIGVAPFYFPLSLVLSCPGLSPSRKVDGIEKSLIDQFQANTFSFKGIPATLTCLRSVSFSFDSPMLFAGRPIKFAQGTTGLVKLTIPLPPRIGRRATEEGNTDDIDFNFVLMDIITNREVGSIKSGNVIDLADLKDHQLELRAEL